MKLRAFFAVGSTFLLVGAFASIGACVGEPPPPPGFQNLGGESSDGGAGQGGASESTNAGPTTSPGSGPSSTSAGPSASQTTGSGPSTSNTTASTSVTSSSTGGLMCDDQGPGEPNDTESTAVDLGTIDDCDSSGSSVAGMLAGIADTDWYKFQGADTFGCNVDPTRDLTSSAPVRLCKFAQCADGATNVTCPGGTSDATSPDGRPGCCGAAGFTLDVTCGSSSLNSDDMLVYMRIETETNDCVTYDLAYHF